MRWASCVTIIALTWAGPIYAQATATKPQLDCHKTLFGGTSCTKVETSGQATTTEPAATKCRFGTTAAGRLMCANPKLASMDLKLSRVLRDAKQGLTPESQKVLEKEQRAWIRDRNKKCGLQGKDTAPLDQLRGAEQCIEDEISQRLAALQNRAQTNSTNSNPCQSAKNAAARLICSDAHLAEIDLALTKAFQEAEEAASPADQNRIAQEQLAWEETRDKKCGLTGLDAAPLDQVLPAKPCLEREISARFSAVRANARNNSATSSIGSSSQDVAITPIVATATTTGSADLESKSFEALSFSKSPEAVRGIIKCSAPATNKDISTLAGATSDGNWLAIEIDDDANSYRIFKDDKWAPVLNSIRTAARLACAAALASGSLKNNANGIVKKLEDRFEAYTPHGLFVAYSTGENAPWTLQVNLPKTRQELKTQLRIDSWVDPSQLINNPYFYKDMVVGTVLQFNHMLSQNDAVFTREGGDIFVAGVPANLFKPGELIVLAGRVKGNKGVIKSSGDEAIMPALEYVSTAKCGDICQALERLPTARPSPPPTAEPGK